MFYEIDVDNKLYKTDISNKREATKIANKQWETGNYKSVTIFRKYPETAYFPSHTEIVYLKIK